MNAVTSQMSVFSSRNTKVLLLGSLPSTLLDYLASWASICRPIYIHGRGSTEGTSLSGPRALKRCARRETRRSASDEIDEWLTGDHPTVLGIVIQYNILPSIPLIYDLKEVSRAYVRLVGPFLIKE